MLLTGVMVTFVHLGRFIFIISFDYETTRKFFSAERVHYEGAYLKGDHGMSGSYEADAAFEFLATVTLWLLVGGIFWNHNQWVLFAVAIHDLILLVLFVIHCCKLIIINSFMQISRYNSVGLLPTNLKVIFAMTVIFVLMDCGGIGGISFIGFKYWQRHQASQDFSKRISDLVSEEDSGVKEPEEQPKPDVKENTITDIEIKDARQGARSR